MLTGEVQWVLTLPLLSSGTSQSDQKAHLLNSKDRKGNSLLVEVK